jgi:hypothetical protein
MNMTSQDLERQVLQPKTHQKILLRAAELIDQGWTRGTAARDADGQKVRSTSPQASAWCVVGAMDRALHELLNLDAYALLGLEIEAYDKAPCPPGVLRLLRRPLQRVLGHCGPAQWNDRICPGQDAAAQLLRQAAARIGLEDASTCDLQGVRA